MIGNITNITTNLTSQWANYTLPIKFEHVYATIGRWTDTALAWGLPWFISWFMAQAWYVQALVSLGALVLFVKIIKWIF